MNFYTISLLDDLAGRNISKFCNLNFVKPAVLFSDQLELSMRLQSIVDSFYAILKKLDIIPNEAFKKEHVCSFDFTDLNDYDPIVLDVIAKLNWKAQAFKEVFPIHHRYTEGDSMHLVVGIAYLEDIRNGYVHFVDLYVPKHVLQDVPSDVSYIKDLLKSYNLGFKQTLQNYIESQGYNYEHFQRDSKSCLGDSFYRFWLKTKMLEAVSDIAFTTLSLKEIAFKNNFSDYENMHKVFVRNGIRLGDIPRLAKLKVRK